ncbi:MAG: hypothetical protein AB7S81_03210 [Bdellovibrionales bacterium]
MKEFEEYLRYADNPSSTDAICRYIRQINPEDAENLIKRLS